MRYKPVPQKNKPVDKIVNHAKHILPLLLNEGRGFNEMFLKGQQTGLTSYKQDVIDTKNTLQDAELIDEIPDPKHSQKLINQLTPMGRELADVLKNVMDYNRSYLELKAAMEKNFRFELNNYKDPSVLANVLRSRGWTEDEISRFFKSGIYGSSAVHFFELDSPWSVIRILLAKYSMIIFDYRPNQIAKDIIDEFFVGLMTEQLFSILDFITTIRKESMLDNTTNDFIAKLWPNILFGGSLFKDCHFMNKYIENVLLATFSLLRSNKERIKEEIDFLTRYIIPSPRTNDDGTLPEDKTLYDDQQKVVSLLEKVLAKLP